MCKNNMNKGTQRTKLKFCDIAEVLQKHGLCAKKYYFFRTTSRSVV